MLDRITGSIWNVTQQSARRSSGREGYDEGEGRQKEEGNFSRASVQRNLIIKIPCDTCSTLMSFIPERAGWLAVAIFQVLLPGRFLLLVDGAMLH